MADRNITIWNDNIYTDNYKLYFVDNDPDKPENIILTVLDDDKRNPVEKWQFIIVDKDYVDKGLILNVRKDISPTKTTFTLVAFDGHDISLPIEVPFALYDFSMVSVTQPDGRIKNTVTFYKTDGTTKDLVTYDDVNVLATLKNAQINNVSKVVNSTTKLSTYTLKRVDGSNVSVDITVPDSVTQVGFNDLGGGYSSYYLTKNSGDSIAQEIPVPNRPNLQNVNIPSDNYLLANVTAASVLIDRYGPVANISVRFTIGTDLIINGQSLFHFNAFQLNSPSGVSPIMELQNPPLYRMGGQLYGMFVIGGGVSRIEFKLANYDGKAILPTGQYECILKTLTS